MDRKKYFERAKDKGVPITLKLISVLLIYALSAYINETKFCSVIKLT
jgi:hypothetical protein